MHYPSAPVSHGPPGGSTINNGPVYYGAFTGSTFNNGPVQNSYVNVAQSAAPLPAQGALQTVAIKPSLQPRKRTTVQSEDGTAHRHLVFDDDVSAESSKQNHWDIASKRQRTADRTRSIPATPSAAVEAVPNQELSQPAEEPYNPVADLDEIAPLFPLRTGEEQAWPSREHQPATAEPVGAPLPREYPSHGGNGHEIPMALRPNCDVGAEEVPYLYLDAQPAVEAMSMEQSTQNEEVVEPVGASSLWPAEMYAVPTALPYVGGTEEEQANPHLGS